MERKDNGQWHYSCERNVQIVLALLKKHGIKRVIASPGSTNVCMVGSMQSDPYFELYSCVDERSAAYMAVGMARETGEPVVLSCTGATSSRNYMPALTEAYYTKLPIIAITSSQPSERIGNLITQVTDRRTLPADVAKISVQIPPIMITDDTWNCRLLVNKALSECKRNGGGPVHINLQTNNSRDFSVTTLPNVPLIERIEAGDEFPTIEKNKRIAILIGCHLNFNADITKLIETFCERYNAVVLKELTSGYHGKYGVVYDLIAGQQYSDHSPLYFDIMIHIGEMAGADFQSFIKAKSVWRVHPDGEMKDPFKSLGKIFQMSEKMFFTHYVEIADGKCETSLYDEIHGSYVSLRKKLNESKLPLSNIWIAQQMASKMPANSEIHAGIMNSFRAWNLVELPPTVHGYCNVGGYGIDGCVSSMIGASLIHKNKLYFGVYGDLAFFYDMNVLGNHHIGRNVRILLVNNGRGNEFHNDCQTWANCFSSEEVDRFGAAAGHFGCKSPELVKSYAENLGFKYLSASSKEEFLSQLPIFVDENIGERPALFEVFTSGDDDAEAYHIMRNLEVSQSKVIKSNVMQKARSILGDNLARAINNAIKG